MPPLDPQHRGHLRPDPLLIQPVHPSDKGQLAEGMLDGAYIIWLNQCMKTITINVSEPTYREFQEYAKRHDRKTSELIREAMEAYRRERIEAGQSGSLASVGPVSVGKILQPLDREDDLLGEMTNL